ncbi:hypothetical protein ACFWN7_16010 [Agromyces sp. NPDC058484]|uniref:hypothetical protein n=1 Tax=Agromyces sp. NPDC058484 TaxID=3346524 RepID=UPI0036612686
MKLSHWIGAGLAAAAVGSTVAFTAPAFATPTSASADVSAPAAASPTAEPTDLIRPDLCPAQRIRILWAAAPDELKDDLREAWNLGPGEERRDALKQVRDDELAGEYGKGVQKFAERRQTGWVAAWKGAPEELKSDLKALRDLTPGEERRDAAIDVFDRALAGDYGSAAQTRAARMLECHVAK